MTIMVGSLLMVSNGCKGEMPLATDISIEIWKLDTLVANVQPEEETEDPKKPEPITYTEMNLTFSLLKEVTDDAFADWLKQANTAVQNSQDWAVVLFSHNMIDSPQKQWTAWWTSLNAWTKFAESDTWKEILSDLHTKYAYQINVEIWKSKRKPFLAPEETEEHPVKPEPFKETNTEVVMNFNLMPGTSDDQYVEWLNSANIKTKDTRGCEGTISSENILRTCQFQWVSWWNDLSAWTEFVQKKDWNEIVAGLSTCRKK